MSQSSYASVSQQQENDLRARQLRSAATLEDVPDVPFTENRGEFMPVTFSLSNGDYSTSIIPTVFVQEAIENKPSKEFWTWIETNADRLKQFSRSFVFIVNNLYIYVSFRRVPTITVSKLPI